MTRLILVALVLGAGCAPRGVRPDAKLRPALSATPTLKVSSEDEYNAARADYDALAVDSPERPGRRAGLQKWLLSQIDHALAGGHLEDAHDDFKQALTLYDADELRGKLRDPALLDAAERLERAFRKRGAHEEVITALAVQVAIVDDERAVRDRYAQVTAWLRSGGVPGGPEDQAAAIDGRERVVEDLEAVARVWPSAFVVDQLSALLLERAGGESQIGLFNRKLRRGADLRALLNPGTQISPSYELARLYLRVSRPDEALAHLKRLAGSPGDDPQVRTLVEKYAAPAAQPGDAVLLANLFAQPGRDDRDVSVRICKDASRRFPKAPEPRLCTGKFAITQNQLVVALKSFEEAVDLDPSRYETWEALAKLYQARLFQVVNDENLKVADLEKELRRVETFHTDAQRRFPDRTIRPSMPDALFEVSRGYYNVGRIDEAVKYLERTLQLQPSTAGYELYGQIKLKRGQPKEAIALFEKAASIPRQDKGEQLWWRAKVRRQLADAQEAAGDLQDAEATRKATLSDWDVLIGYGLTPEANAEAHLEKGKLLYLLGDREGSLDNMRKSIDAAPHRQSTYADSIAFLVPRGELEEALDAYHRALGRDEREVSDYIKVYCSLWVLDLARRAGEPEDPLALAYLKSADGAKWYHSLARWATGRETETEVQPRVDTPARRAEWSFYRAMRALRESKLDEAKRLWQDVLDTDMMAFFEYDMAAHYLKRGGAPSQPVLKSKLREAPKPKPPAGS